MGGDVILNLVKTALIGIVAILLGVSLWQANEVEGRVRDLQLAVSDLREAAAKGGFARGAAGGTDVVPVTPAEADPRTLPYWKTDDNILTDPAREPAPPPGAPRGGTIHYYTRSNPISLNVHVLNEAELQERIAAPVYEYMAEQSRIDPDDYVAGICNRATVNADFTEFTCYVRKGVYWHPPYVTGEERRGSLRWLADLPRQEVTAEDIKFTFDTIMNPLSECSSEASYLGDVAAVEVVDPYVVKIRWKRSLYYNKSTTFGLLMIYPKFIFGRDERGNPLPDDLVAPTFPKHWYSKRMCGTGPFQFDGFVDNQFIRLKRNPDWWNPGKPVIDGVYLHIQAEPEILLSMFRAGKIDVFYATPAQYRAQYLEGKEDSLKGMVDRGEATLKLWETFAYYYFGWNLRLPQLAERQVRRALAHLYPEEQIIRDVYYGLAVPHDSPVHRWEAAYVKDLEPFPLDIARAAAILDEAGWRIGSEGVREKMVDGKPVQLRFRMLFPTSSNTIRDAVLLYQKSAEKAGILIEPQPREWQAMIKMLDDKEFEACALGWGNSWDADPSQIWHSDSARAAKGSNYGSYISPEVDACIESLKTEFDPDKRKLLWEKFQRTIVGDEPYRFSVIPTRPWFVSSRLGNPYFAKLRPQDWFLPWFVKDPK